MEYLIRFAQVHETFRRPELEAIAELAGVDLEILEYTDDVGLNCFVQGGTPERGRSEGTFEL